MSSFCMWLIILVPTIVGILIGIHDKRTRKKLSRQFEDEDQVNFTEGGEG